MTPLFAELDGTGWAIVIAAGCTGLGGIIANLVNSYLNYLDRVRQDKREDERLLREAEAAEKQDVREAEKNVKLDSISTGVEQVHTATNSLQDKLVASVKEAAFAAGIKSETAKEK